MSCSQFSLREEPISNPLEIHYETYSDTDSMSFEYTPDSILIHDEALKDNPESSHPTSSPYSDKGKEKMIEGEGSEKVPKAQTHFVQLDVYPGCNLRKPHLSNISRKCLRTFISSPPMQLWFQNGTKECIIDLLIMTLGSGPLAIGWGIALVFQVWNSYAN